MYEIFADLHVHIGRSENGKPIKITAARSLNFANIAKECAERKGINIVGIIDCASPYVIEDIEKFLQTGEAYELKDGGIIKLGYNAEIDKLKSIRESNTFIMTIFLAGENSVDNYTMSITSDNMMQNDYGVLYQDFIDKLIEGKEKELASYNMVLEKFSEKINPRRASSPCHIRQIITERKHP